MVFIRERKINGEVYLYIEKTVRAGKRILKVSDYLGKKEQVTKTQREAEIKNFTLKIDEKTRTVLKNNIEKMHRKFEYPLTREEALKIEEMNIKYKEIKKTVDKKDWTDIRKRFIANFVFESNALEGNSLTLKNVAEIVFENRINNTAELRDVYDAKNSYRVFSALFNGRKELTQEIIIKIHKELMKGIDTRTGYKKVPNVIIGRQLQLTTPEAVEESVKMLVEWYEENKEKAFPLELAYKFHHRFEQIHPFADGNGRVGRMLLNYILIKRGYYPVIVRRTQRGPYLKALEAADRGKYIPLMRFAIKSAKETYQKFFEVYFKHTRRINAKEKQWEQTQKKGEG